MKDAWHSERFVDKLKIWFMPTGWRPEDVNRNYPLEQIDDPYKLKKYNTDNPLSLHVWSWVQYVLTLFMMLHMFTVIGDVSFAMGYMYAIFLLIQIFSLTSLLDGKYYSIIADILKIGLAFTLIYYQGYLWYGISGIWLYLLLIYLVGSLILTYIFLSKKQIQLV